MSVVGIIPARGGSLRLPGKNIRPIAGKPLIVHSIEMALKATSLDAVIVTTDDDEIGETARAAGATVIVRPAELATPTAPIDDALRHAVTAHEAASGHAVAVVVSMQANTPVRREGEIDAVVERLRATPGATAVATAYRLSERLHWAKALADPSTMEVRPLVNVTEYRVQDLPPLYLLDGAIIAVRADVLARTAGNRRAHAYLGERICVFEHDERYATEVDEHHDVAMAEGLLRERS